MLLRECILVYREFDTQRRLERWIRILPQHAHALQYACIQKVCCTVLSAVFVALSIQGVCLVSGLALPLQIHSISERMIAVFMVLLLHLYISNLAQCDVTVTIMD